jgi:hypothetical protein
MTLSKNLTRTESDSEADYRLIECLFLGGLTRFGTGFVIRLWLCFTQSSLSFFFLLFLFRKVALPLCKLVIGLGQCRDLLIMSIV